MTSCAPGTAVSSASHEISDLLASYLKTRVARRLYGLFAVVALAPVVMLGIYAYFQVTTFLIDTSQERLREESKALGMDVLARLEGLTEELRVQALLLERHGLSPQPIGAGFSEIRVTETKDFVQTGQHPTHHLPGGVVRLLSGPRGEYRLLLSLPGQSAVFEGTLSPDALWPDRFDGRPFCLLDAAGHSIYCSPEAAGLESELPIALDQDSGTRHLLVGGEPFLAGYWRVSLEILYYTLSLHDALPISELQSDRKSVV